MATKKTEEIINIEMPVIEKYIVTIEGDTPLIVHAWDEKAKRMMLETQMGIKKAKKRENRRPFRDFFGALYWLSEKPEDPGTDEGLQEAFEEAVKNGARFGFSASAIKQCANVAAYRRGYVKNQMGLRGAWFIPAEKDGLIEVKSEEPPAMREDMVTVGISGTDLRYRPEFSHWHIDIPVELDETSGYTIEFLAAALQHGGRSVGLGEWRPEKDGDFGRFHVANIQKLG